LKTLKNELLRDSLKHEFRVSEKDFSRKRKQPFSATLLFMINLLRKSLAIEIDSFMNFLYGKQHTSKSFTQSAFVQARKKISPDVFKKLSQTIINEFYTDNQDGIGLWNGFRVLAVDGSRITLPNTDELEANYGKTKNQSQTSIVQARCPVLYDVENNYVIDGTLAPLAEGERALAISHLHHCKLGDLLIYDRGYPSYGLIHEHISRELDYVIRVKPAFSQLIMDFESSKKKSQLVNIFPGKNTKLSDKPYDRNTPIKVRLVRVDLPSGQVEILITSLLSNKTYPHRMFKALYAKRWGVETFYDELKVKLKIENFSGYSPKSILQDFYATLFVSNVQTLIVSELEEEMAKETQTRKYKYKVNKNLSYGFLKNRIIGLFINEEDIKTVISELKELFKKHLIPIRPNRSNKREIGKYRSRIKPVITKNQKDAL
jgi:hypothetical protein